MRVAVALLFVSLLCAVPLGAQEAEEVPGIVAGLGTIDDGMADALRGVTGETFERALASLELEPIEGDGKIVAANGMESKCRMLVGKPSLKYLLFFSNLDIHTVRALVDGIGENGKTRLAVRYTTADGKTYEKKAKEFPLNAEGRSRRYDFRWVLPVEQWISFELRLEIDPAGNGAPDDVRSLQIVTDTAAVLERLHGG